MKPAKFNNEIVTTIVGQETTFSGTINTQESIRIEGKIEGEVISQGEVYIGQKSKVRANIIAKRVVIAGEVWGNIEASKGLRICESGRVYGDITGANLVVEEGAVYRGKVNMDVISAENIYEGKFELIKDQNSQEIVRAG